MEALNTFSEYNDKEIRSRSTEVITGILGARVYVEYDKAAFKTRKAGSLRIHRSGDTIAFNLDVYSSNPESNEIEALGELVKVLSAIHKDAVSIRDKVVADIAGLEV